MYNPFLTTGFIVAYILSGFVLIHIGYGFYRNWKLKKENDKK